MRSLIRMVGTALGPCALALALSSCAVAADLNDYTFDAPPSPNSGGGASGAGQSSAGGNSATCYPAPPVTSCTDVSFGDYACDGCAQSACCSVIEACALSGDCAGLSVCLSGPCALAADPYQCAQTTCPSCLSQTAMDLLAQASECVAQSCTAACAGDGNV